MNALLHASVQSSTAKQYNNVWNNISSFVVNKLRIPLNLPLQNKTVGLYISHLHLLGLRPSTIQSHLSAISHYHKIRDLNDPTQSFLISKLMSSLHKLSPLSDNRLPVTFELLENIISSLDHVCSSQYDVLLYSAMVSFAYHACLRVGEYCTTGNPDNVLNIDQVTNVSRDGQLCALRIYFKKYKHSNADHPVHEIDKQDGPVCPVTLLNKYINLRPNYPGPLFLNSCGRPISRNQFLTVFHKSIAFLSLDISRYNTHSLRIGRCTDMVFLGFTDAQIKAAGRWKTDAYKKYIRPDVIRV